MNSQCNGTIGKKTCLLYDFLWKILLLVIIFALLNTKLVEIRVRKEILVLLVSHLSLGVRGCLYSNFCLNLLT